MFTYSDLVAFIEKKYPKENNFCSVAAIALVTGKRVGRVRGALFRAGRKEGKGVYKAQMLTALRELGFEPVGMRDEPCTVASFRCEASCLVFVRGHVAAYVKGAGIQDWTAGRRHKVTEYWILRPTAK